MHCDLVSFHCPRLGRTPNSAADYNQISLVT
ncbi:MAG: hypothetical protein ACI91G_001426, partial [Gammaproteobacteria bacterium]